MKRILDSVHGYIMVEDKFIQAIVDTQLFQRLRRIEQTSIRAVYPSARHDRFMHSLGVYHVGCLIVEHLKKDSTEYAGIKMQDVEIWFESYLAACLLHDIGHAPFSHTFEDYYGSEGRLAKLLESTLSNPIFTSDLNEMRKNEEAKPHEYMSAYVVAKNYSEVLISELHLNLELIIRMVIGNSYTELNAENSFKNCLISLLHGNVIDADRMDYACRDVWASGYSTSLIDMQRLISGLHIVNNNGIFKVCIDCNAINEVDNLLNVKDFQMKYVINHHTVNYEQWLLKKAAETMASYLFSEDFKKGGATSVLLGNIISGESILSGIVFPDAPYRITNITDDDLVFLMKQDPSNHFYKEWSSRKYQMFALWKSREEFYCIFSGIQKKWGNLKNNQFEEEVSKILINNGIEKEDFIITEATFKPRVCLDSLYVKIRDQIIKYTDLHPESKDRLNSDQTFYYVFIQKTHKNKRETILKDLKPIIENLYMH